MDLVTFTEEILNENLIFCTGIFKTIIRSVRIIKSFHPVSTYAKIFKKLIFLTSDTHPYVFASSRKKF